jgi:hypothetical protein
MASDQVVYLNGDTALLQGSFVSALESLPAKLQKAPMAEWKNTFKSLTSKGLVKAAEIEDSEIEEWMVAQGPGSITRVDLTKAVKDRAITIKEVTLGKPHYEGASHSRLVAGQGVYNEILFIANSVRANMEDRIEELDWQIEQFNFDMTRLSEDPESLMRLLHERKLLMGSKANAHEFRWSHFSSSQQYGKRLIAHARELVTGNVFLVEEIQSDWGQRGRQDEWKSIPKGPFVTDTKLWAGLAIRRMMQRAACNPAVERFYWIRGSMRNGADGEYGYRDGLDEFYLKTVSGLVDKIIGPAGEKARLGDLVLGQKTLRDLPCFDMTPAVRERLKQTLPLYSLTDLLPRPAKISDRDRTGYMSMVEGMIGTSRNVRIVDHLYDVAMGREVAGSYINGMVQASLRAADLEGVLSHECFHFGMDKLFTMDERRMVLTSFAPGQELNTRIKTHLRNLNDMAAYEQCNDAEEAASYAFAHWAKGNFDLKPAPVRTLFQSLRDTVAETMSWIRKKVMDQPITTPEELFTAFAQGDYAAQGAAVQPSNFRAAEIRRSETQRS